MAAFQVNLVLMCVLPQALATFAPSSSARLTVITPDAGSAPPLRDPDAEELIQVDSIHETQSELRPPNPASWFGGFAEAESTYDHDGKIAGRRANTQINVLDGWNPQQQNPFFKRAAGPEWFEESRSGGQKQAWQSFYPSSKGSIAGNRVDTGEWYTGKGGTWQQAYVSPNTLESSVLGTVQGYSRDKALPAAWFDNSVEQLDGFGREKFPGLGSPRNFFDWEERSVNTSLACQKPGCTANVSLKAPFDFNTQIAKNCRLSVFFHPTDFDDWYGGEVVEWVQVNNQQVAAKCHPRMDGCNKTATRPLLPCVSDIPINHLLPKNGDLKIAAKIPTMVDECPYNGKMLSGVPMVTCLVSNKNGSKKPKPVSALESNGTCITKMPLQCKTKGCASEIAIPVNSTCAALGNCMLSIEVQQTDFDNKDGTIEHISYIKVDGKQVKKDVNPGQNPCKSKWEGKNLTLAQMKFSALSNHKVNVTTGRVLVEGKITQHVDECASNGYLFDAMATVTCGKGGKAKAKSFLQTGSETPVKKASAPRRLRGYSL